MSKIAILLERIFNKFGTFNYSIFKRIHFYFVDNYIVYYDTLQNYQDRVKPPFKRRLFYHGINLVLVSALIKFLFFTLVEDVSFKVNMGDIFYIFISYHKKVYIYFSTVLALIILFRLVIFYYEKKLTININEILTTNNGRNIFKYNNNENSFLIIANSAYWITKLYMIFSCSVSTLHTLCSIYAYIYIKHNYNFAVLIISTIHNIFCIKIIDNNFMGSAIISIITLNVLKLKQNDIIKSIRFNVLWRNKVRIYDNLKDYHQFTRLVDKLSKFINVMCGIMYLLTPLIISHLLWVLTEEESENIWENLFEIIFTFLVTLVIFIIYIFGNFVSNITKVNQTLPKYLSSIFKDKNFTRFEHKHSLNLNYNFGQLSDIMVRIKIDSFIARLNEEFVGFYCFNLFKVTKLSFFKYIYIFMSVFVLIQNM